MAPLSLDPEYVLARRVLLDALDALAPHRDALVLVGAQAIYLRVGEADLAVAPYTTDGDLAIEPSALGTIPPLEQALRDAAFVPDGKSPVGVWVGGGGRVKIDLLVPASLSPRVGRGAGLPGHAATAARTVAGMEGAVVDADRMTLDALDPIDPRKHELRVAGAAALLVSKLHKIAERQGTHRQNDKDALDVLRLLRGTTTEELTGRYLRLLGDGRSGAAAANGRALLERQFVGRRAVGVEMAVRSTELLEDGDTIAAACQELARQLLAGIR